MKSQVCFENIEYRGIREHESLVQTIRSFLNLSIPSFVKKNNIKKMLKERGLKILNMYFKLFKKELESPCWSSVEENRRLMEQIIPPIPDADKFSNNLSTSTLCSAHDSQCYTYKESLVLIKYPMYYRLLNSLRKITMSAVSKPKVIFVLGGPGAGKGTQCTNIVNKFGYVHLSAGELLREEQNKSGSKFGELIEGHMVNGTIVPVEITCSLLEQAMDTAPTKKFLIDGFPRNKDNLDGWNKAMSEKVKLLGVLFFDCSEQTCVDRCLKRGAAGSGRTDDNEETLKKRYQTYLNATLSIVKHYDGQGLVFKVDASQSADKVFEEVDKIFNQVWN